MRYSWKGSTKEYDTKWERDYNMPPGAQPEDRPGGLTFHVDAPYGAKEFVDKVIQLLQNLPNSDPNARSIHIEKIDFHVK